MRNDAEYEPTISGVNLPVANVVKITSQQSLQDTQRCLIVKYHMAESNARPNSADATLERLVRIAILDNDGRILLQKRATSKRHFPDRWTETATGHIEDNESPHAAANRELSEETGLSLVIHPIGTDTLATPSTIQENHIFAAVANSTVLPRIEPGEGTGFKWIDMEMLHSEASENPDLYTPGLIKYLNLYRQYLDPRN